MYCIGQTAERFYGNMATSNIEFRTKVNPRSKYPTCFKGNTKMSTQGRKKTLPRAVNNHRPPKISFLVAESIRERVSAGETQAALSREHGVHASEICQIVRRKRLAQDLELESVWRQFNNAERNYEAAQTRLDDFKERRRLEASSLLRNTTVNT